MAWFNWFRKKEITVDAGKHKKDEVAQQTEEMVRGERDTQTPAQKRGLAKIVAETKGKKDKK